MKQIHLFRGENVYALDEEKRRWSVEFQRRHGADNLIRLSGDGLTCQALLDAISVMPFLAEKRLVIVEPLPDFSEEQWSSVRSSIHPDVLLLLVERRATPARGRRKKASGADATAVADVTKEFAPLSSADLLAWMRERARSHGTGLASGAEQALVGALGGDQALIASEIDKLALASSGDITPALVEELVSPTDEGVIWRITDVIGRGRLAEAHAFGRRFLDRGGEPFQLWNTLLLFVRHAAVVADLIDSGRPTQDAVREGGVPYPMLTALTSFVRRAGPEAVTELVSECCDLDRALKTGELRASDEANAEILAVLDRLLVRLSGSGDLTRSRPSS